MPVSSSPSIPTPITKSTLDHIRITTPLSSRLQIPNTPAQPPNASLTGSQGTPISIYSSPLTDRGFLAINHRGFLYANPERHIHIQQHHCRRRRNHRPLDRHSRLHELGPPERASRERQRRRESGEHDAGADSGVVLPASGRVGECAERSGVWLFDFGTGMGRWCWMGGREASDVIVQFLCDGETALPYAPFGQEV
jgi:hypothetical protein